MLVNVEGRHLKSLLNSIVWNKMNSTGVKPTDLLAVVVSVSKLPLFIVEWDCHRAIVDSCPRLFMTKYSCLQKTMIGVKDSKR